MIESFTKDNTNIVKGIAIIAMVTHHFFVNDPGMSIISMGEIDIAKVIGELSKVCVSLFCIMSGYGLATKYSMLKQKSVKSSIKFVLSHLFQFISIYIFCYLFMLVLNLSEKHFVFSNLYGKGIKSILLFVLDLFGISHLMGAIGLPTKATMGDWFVGAIMLFYIIFPIVYYLTKKFCIIVLIISYIPWIVWLIFLNMREEPTNNILFYIFSFCIGIFFSQKNILTHLKGKAFNTRIMIVSLASLFVFIVLRLFITLPMDPFVAVSIIMFSITFVDKTKVTKKVLTIFGENSANMWLVNLFFISIIRPRFSIMILGLICANICLLIYSMILEKIKKWIGYKKLVKTIRLKIESNY